jgi:hypothetical protein
MLWRREKPLPCHRSNHGRPSHGLSLYWLGYPDSFIISVKYNNTGFKYTVSIKSSSCKHSNKPLDSIKGKAFLLCVHDCCPAILPLLGVYMNFLCFELHKYSQWFFFNYLYISLELRLVFCKTQAEVTWGYAI